MGVMRTRYRLLADFERVWEFLGDHYVYPKWFLTPQAFEYAHTHSYFNFLSTPRFGIWEEGGAIVAAAFYEMDLGECILAVKPGYEHLKEEMLAYSEKELSKCEGGKRSLTVFVMNEPDLIEILKKSGYEMIYSEPVKMYDYAKGFEHKPLPDGFSIVSAEAELDLAKINACFWQGFDHGPVPEPVPLAHLEGNLYAQSGPRFRKELGTTIQAPDGDYACCAGMWIDEKNGYAYLEPLATVPKYRRMGLATIAFMESMKKTVPLGAKYSYSGSREFYTAIGCDTVGHWEKWKKEW